MRQRIVELKWQAISMVLRIFCALYFMVILRKCQNLSYCPGRYVLCDNVVFASFYFTQFRYAPWFVNSSRKKCWLNVCVLAKLGVVKAFIRKMGTVLVSSTTLYFIDKKYSSYPQQRNSSLRSSTFISKYMAKTVYLYSKNNSLDCLLK